MSKMGRGHFFKPSFLSMPPMRYPNEYVWLIFVSSLDIMLTWVILTRYDGNEANPIANIYLRLHGFKGLIIFKFCLMMLVVVICETVGRSNDRWGRLLSKVGVGISTLPTLVSCAILISNFDSAPVEAS